MTQLNLQKPTNHLFQITRPNLKTFTYQVQAVTLPGFSASTAAGPAPKISDFSVIGTSAIYGDLVLSILLDENMDTYFEIYQWLKELVEPEKGTPVKFNDSVAEAVLYILTNNKTLNNDFAVNFHKLWPYAISEIPFDATTSDDAPLSFTATFKYRTFDITRNGTNY